MNSTENSNEIKKSKRGGARPGAGRPRKKDKAGLSQADVIPILEKQIQDPDISPRDLNTATRKLSILRGWGKPYARTKSEQAEVEQKRAESELPTWWTDEWAKIFISERACAIGGGWHRFKDLMNEYEVKWAEQEELSVEQLREALRAEEKSRRENPNDHQRV